MVHPPEKSPGSVSLGNPSRTYTNLGEPVTHFRSNVGYTQSEILQTGNVEEVPGRERNSKSEPPANGYGTQQQPQASGVPSVEDGAERNRRAATLPNSIQVRNTMHQEQSKSQPLFASIPAPPERPRAHDVHGAGGKLHAAAGSSAQGTVRPAAATRSNESGGAEHRPDEDRRTTQSSSTGIHPSDEKGFSSCILKSKLKKGEDISRGNTINNNYSSHTLPRRSSMSVAGRSFQQPEHHHQHAAAVQPQSQPQTASNGRPINGHGTLPLPQVRAYNTVSKMYGKKKL